MPVLLISITRISLSSDAVWGLGVTAATVTPAELVFSSVFTAAGSLVAATLSGLIVLVAAGTFADGTASLEGAAASEFPVA